MAIELCVGATGAGKSYRAVSKYVVQAIEEDRKILTNLPLNIEAIEEAYPGKSHLIEFREFTLDPETWKSDWTDQDGDGMAAQIIVDEAANILYKGSVKVADPIHEFFRMHRHAGYDILLIAQGDVFIDSNVRWLCEVLDDMMNLEVNGIQGRFRATRYKLTQTSRGEVIDVTNGKYEKEIFNLYSSRTLSSAKGKNRKRVGVTPIWLRRQMLFTYFVIISVLCAVAVVRPWEIMSPEVIATEDVLSSSSSSSRVVKNMSGKILAGHMGNKIGVYDNGSSIYWIDQVFEPLSGRCAIRVNEVVYRCGEQLPIIDAER